MRYLVCSVPDTPRKHFHRLYVEGDSADRTARSAERADFHAYRNGREIEQNRELLLRLGKFAKAFTPHMSKPHSESITLRTRDVG